MGFGKSAVFFAFLALFVYYLPYPVLWFNSFTPFKICHTDAWKKIMDFRRSFRPIRDPVPLPEIDYKDITKEIFMQMTADLSRPIVVRNVIKSQHLNELSDMNYWSEHYGNSTINCIDMDSELYKACTVNEWIEYNVRRGRNIYSRTNHQILYENPELREKLSSPISDWVGPEPLYEIFLGFQDGGSPLHAAFGVNLFKQITGRKKWTLWPPSELPFMDLHLSDDAASLLAIGKRPTYTDAEWIKHTFRYETIVNAGDVLFNPCMWMHIVENMPGANKNDVIIGSPERHFGVKYGWKTSPYITTHLILKKILIKIYQKLNGINAEKTALDFLPIVDAASAKGFDEYIRMRADEYNGAQLN